MRAVYPSLWRQRFNNFIGNVLFLKVQIVQLLELDNWFIKTSSSFHSGEKETYQIEKTASFAKYCSGKRERLPLRIVPLSITFRYWDGFAYKLCLFSIWQASVRIGPTQA
jgi:hypothetical protein